MPLTRFNLQKNVPFPFSWLQFHYKISRRSSCASIPIFQSFWSHWWIPTNITQYNWTPSCMSYVFLLFLMPQPLESGVKEQSLVISTLNSEPVPLHMAQPHRGPTWLPAAWVRLLGFTLWGKKIIIKDILTMFDRDWHCKDMMDWHW